MDDQTSRYEAAMRLALAEATLGPTFGANPQVGCVIIDESGAVIAVGHHNGAGTPHAEINALAALTTQPDPTLAIGATLVVTLEPCNHHGRTGPCAEAIVASGVTRVVYSVADPGQVSAGGAATLRAAGIEVIGGVLAEEGEALIHSWLTATRQGRPYVVAKWGGSMDARVAAADGSSQWITGEASRNIVHRKRAEVDAILVGINTVLIDNPSLTARDTDGNLYEHQPVPVVIGKREIPADYQILAHPAGYLRYETHDLAAVLADLFERGFRKVIVEGGATLTSAFFAAGLVNELDLYLGPVLLGGPKTATTDLGVSTLVQGVPLDITLVERLGNDVHIEARVLPRSTGIADTEKNEG